MNRQRHKQHPEVLILMLGVGVFAAMVLLSQFEVQERFFGTHRDHPYEAVDAEHHVTTGVYTSRDGVVHDGHAEARARASTGADQPAAQAGGPAGAQVSSNIDATPPLDLAGGPAQYDVPDFRPPVKSAREVYLELRKQEESKQAEAMTKQAEATAMALRVEAAKVAAEKEATVKAAAAKEAALKELAEKDAILKAQAVKDAAIKDAANKEAATKDAVIKDAAKKEAAVKQRLLASASGGTHLPPLPLPQPPGGASFGASGSTPGTLGGTPAATIKDAVGNVGRDNSSASIQSMMPGSASLRNTLPGSKFVSMAQSRGVNVPLADDAVSSTVTRFYGATFVADPKLKLPAKAMFEKPADSRAYQKTIPLKRFYMGGYRVSLQAPAADALIAAQKEASATRLKITPVGDVASLRSYEDTSYIWHKYLDKGLAYWVSRKKITPAQARAILDSPPKKQLSQVIALEQKGLYLHANHAHSILNLAAPPGSSQHISGLALDIEEHQNANVRAILNRHGWYQTVAHDFPHFIYLGRPVNELPQLGLTSIKSDGRQFWVPDVPDNLPPALR